MKTADGERVFSALISAVRNKRGLSQGELAARCGRSQPAVAQWESGKHPLSETTIELVAQGLGLSVLQFLSEGLRALAREGREHQQT